MSSPYAVPVGGFAARGEPDVDPTAGAEVKDGHWVAQIGHRGWVATAERGDERGLGQLATPVAVEPGAEQLGLLVEDDRRIWTAAAPAPGMYDEPMYAALEKARGGGNRAGHSHVRNDGNSETANTAF
jgi:hypothetical protein